jgi:hypothetical protein
MNEDRLTAASKWSLVVCAFGIAWNIIGLQFVTFPPSWYATRWPVIHEVLTELLVFGGGALAVLFAAVAEDQRTTREVQSAIKELS